MSAIVSPQHIWDNEVTQMGFAKRQWIFDGFVARGYTTLLTSLWKAGKTTLLSMLLGRRAGGGSLAGLAVTAGRTALVSEEPLPLWAERIAKYGFGGNVCFFPPSFRGAPSPEEWRAFLQTILAVNQSHGLDLVAIDPLAPLLRCENNARSLQDVLEALKPLTQANLAVLLLHHPAKGDPPIGQAARGSGALLGHVDVSIEMRRPGGDPMTRRRRLITFSRFAETPHQLLLELNEDATDYIRLPDPLSEEFDANWRLVRMVLEDAPQKLTCADILSEWPPEEPKPHPVTLSRWLRRAVANKMVKCEGEGKKADPLRYWFKETEAKWRQQMGPEMYDYLQELSRQRGAPFQSLQEKRRIDAQDPPDDSFSDDDDREVSVADL